MNRRSGMDIRRAPGDRSIDVRSGKSAITRVAGIALGLCMGVASIPAAAAAPQGSERIAVLPPDIAGDSERIEQAISGRLLDGLQRGGFEVVNAPASAVGSTCAAPQCEQQVAQAASAKYVIRTTITPRDNVYDLVLEARDGEGRVIATAEDKCEICGLTELGDLVSDRGAALAQQLELLTAAPPLIIINTTPSGANVWVDDQLVGRTPLEHQVEAGSHEIRVESDGYVAQKRSVTAVAGVKEEVAINLARSAVDANAHPGRGMIIGGAVAMVAGAGLIGGGVPLIIIDSDPIGDPDDPDDPDCMPDGNMECKELYDTLGVGASMAALGAAALAAGIALVAVGVIRRNKASSRFAASPSGFTVRF